MCIYDKANYDQLAFLPINKKLNNMNESIALILSSILIIAGLIGIFLPVLPGLTLIWVGILTHKLLIPDVLSWWTVVLLGVIVIVTTVLEWMSGVWGAKAFGSSKWGMWGAVLGGIVGLFGGLPGLLIGPLIGAFLFELFIAKKKTAQAGKAMVGVATGIVVSGIFKFLVALMMIVWFVIDLWF